MPFLENLGDKHGVEPICHELDIAPSTYYWHQQRRQHPEHRSNRDKSDGQLMPEIRRVFEENYRVYGYRKVWQQLKREGFHVARCTVVRLMKTLKIKGVIRGKGVRTTRSNKAAETPRDLVNRQFVAERPNQLWVADFTYVSTWQGFAYVAFIIDVFAGVIVGWRTSSTMETTFVLDALEQALWFRRPSGTIHHSDKGSQYVSLAYTQRLKDAELLASTGSTGDSYDNALAESVNGLYKAEVIHRKSWKTRQDVELATLEWWTGLTIADCWNVSVISRRWKQKKPTMLHTLAKIWQREQSSKTLQENRGGSVGITVLNIARALGVTFHGLGHALIYSLCIKAFCHPVSHVVKLSDVVFFEDCRFLASKSHCQKREAVLCDVVCA